ncbi:hypothetical protein [Acinetobacter ihumii]|uniref:hypothetical protein n=1 Tax=Acinetobacter ihumii TaxID=2483802 RepID=UPI00102F8CB1|nr:hypothetical protein [Acinetobacter ihumii]
MENWIIPLLGDLGIGSVLTAIITKLLDHFINRKSAKQTLLYKEKREAYFGLLDALHKAAIQPSMENSKYFALWQTRVEVFGTQEIANGVQGMVNTNEPNQRHERDIFFKQLISAIRKDLQDNA